MDVAMTSTTQTACPSCGGPVSEADRYCEACGAELKPGTPIPAALDTDTEPTVEISTSPVGPCQSCGGAIGPEGYCETCGTKAARPRDHFSEQPATWVAGVCDRGIRHSRNHDAKATASDA